MMMMISNGQTWHTTTARVPMTTTFCVRQKLQLDFDCFACRRWHAHAVQRINSRHHALHCCLFHVHKSCLKCIHLSQTSMDIRANNGATIPMTQTCTMLTKQTCSLPRETHTHTQLIASIATHRTRESLPMIDIRTINLLYSVIIIIKNTS